MQNDPSQGASGRPAVVPIGVDTAPVTGRDAERVGDNDDIDYPLERYILEITSAAAEITAPNKQPVRSLPHESPRLKR